MSVIDYMERCLLDEHLADCMGFGPDSQKVFPKFPFFDVHGTFSGFVDTNPSHVDSTEIWGRFTLPTTFHRTPRPGRAFTGGR